MIFYGFEGPMGFITPNSPEFSEKNSDVPRCSHVWYIFTGRKNPKALPSFVGHFRPFPWAMGSIWVFCSNHQPEIQFLPGLWVTELSASWGSTPPNATSPPKIRPYFLGVIKGQWRWPLFLGFISCRGLAWLGAIMIPLDPFGSWKKAMLPFGNPPFQAGYWVSCVGECSRTAEGQKELIQKGENDAAKRGVSKK